MSLLDTMGHRHFMSQRRGANWAIMLNGKKLSPTGSRLKDEFLKIEPARSYRAENVEVMMRHVGRAMVKRIKKRTQEGKNIHGRRFTPLSEWTRKARDPRPKRGERINMTGAKRRGGKNILKGGTLFLKHLTYHVGASQSGRNAAVEVYIKSKNVRLSDGRTMNAADLARVHNDGMWYGAVFKAFPGMRIPVRSKKFGKRKSRGFGVNPGIFTTRISRRRLPKREFMGLTTPEVRKMHSQMSAYIAGNKGVVWNLG